MKSSFWKPAARFLALIFAVSGLVVPHAGADDNIFPPDKAAKSSIDFDGRGFIINGKRTFLSSGSLHYARVPRGLWRDRLLRYKRAGFNCVETYAFWNYHEPKEGQFDFNGEKDLDAFLKLAKSVGLYAVVRVGPYICGEWDSGGYPIWLRFKPGVRVREPNAEYEKYAGRWYDKVMPIIAANQINRGGNVILVQLENEAKGWGRDMPNKHYAFLRDKAKAKGLQVPWFFSGLHHGNDPAGNKSWDSKNRESPWFTTEFWPGWYDQYGPATPEALRKFDRGTWKIIAYGGNGYNYYMAHGGTNFASTNNNEDASSYDYGAAVGQTGDLRPLYYRFKRAAMFAQSFPNILEDSENADASYKEAATGTGVRITARHSDAGDIVFLDNNGADKALTQFKAPDGTFYPTAGPVGIDPGEIMPVVLNTDLAPGAHLDVCAARVLGVADQGSVTTMVVHGAADDPFELRFTAHASKLQGTSSLWTAIGDSLTLKGNFPATGVTTASFTVDDHTVRILAMNSDLADKTWFVGAEGKNYVVSGPDYVGDANVKNGQLALTAERPMSGGPGTAQALVFSDAEQPHLLETTFAAVDESPALDDWKLMPVDGPMAVKFNDGDWQNSAEPLQMGADGDIGPHAWYRVSLEVKTAGAYRLKLGSIRDKAAAWLDGQPISSDKISSDSLSLDLTAGKHTLAIFVSHYGRDKLFGYYGPIDIKDAKGLTGPAVLQALSGPDVELTGWKMKAAQSKPADNPTPPPSDAPDWSDYSIGIDAFANKAGIAWFQTVLPAASADTPSKTLFFNSVDENATVFLNGQKVGQHDGWNQSFSVSLDAAWKNEGPNVLSVLIENTSYTGGIDKPVSLSRLTSETTVTGWRMRGGEGEIPKFAHSAPAATETGVPTWYGTQFKATPPAETGSHSIYRVSLTGMSGGFVYLNGHNLGRYPEKVAVDGLYLPEPWLNDGQNNLAIFDEQGKAPTDVRLVIEAASSRSIGVLVPKQ